MRTDVKPAVGDCINKVRMRFPHISYNNIMNCLKLLEKENHIILENHKSKSEKITEIINILNDLENEADFEKIYNLIQKEKPKP